MKFKLLAMTTLFGVLAAACGNGTTTGGTGGGGTGGGGTGGGSSITTGNTTSTGSAMGSCDDIGVCDGDGMDPNSGCFECSIIGDDTVAVDGGVCVDSYVQCFGTVEDCSDAGNPACCAFANCAAACPDDNAATTDVDENLACLCTSTDNMQCDAMEPAGSTTCIGVNGIDAVQDYLAFVGCVVDDTCPTSCAQ